MLRPSMDVSHPATEWSLCGQHSPRMDLYSPRCSAWIEQDCHEEDVGVDKGEHHHQGETVAVPETVVAMSLLRSVGCDDWVVVCVLLVLLCDGWQSVFLFLLDKLIEIQEKVRIVCRERKKHASPFFLIFPFLTLNAS